MKSMIDASTKIQICETLMLICFGLSWPFSVIKSFKSKTAKGKSVFFQLAIITGYIAGIIGKAIADNFTYIFWLYAINLAMVSLDLILYFRNVELDRKREFEDKCLILDIEPKEEKPQTAAVEEPYEPGMVLSMASLEGMRQNIGSKEEEEDPGVCFAKAALRKI